MHTWAVTQSGMKCVTQPYCEHHAIPSTSYKWKYLNSLNCCEWNSTTG